MDSFAFIQELLQKLVEFQLDIGDLPSELKDST
jgi:hypothetical protein